MRKTFLKKLEAKKLITNYNRFRKNLPSKVPKKVFIWDETLRESERTPTVFLTYVEKVKLAKMMDELGINIINVGFPGFSEEEERMVKRISNENYQQAKIVASSRLTKNDIDACLGCGIEEISIWTTFNLFNLKYRLKQTPEQVIEKTNKCISYAKGHGLTVTFSLSDASRTPLAEIIQIFGEAMNAGANRLVLSDTVGFLRPLSMRYLISRVRDGVSKLTSKPLILSVNCHNAFGLATANTLAAIEEGANYPHTSVLGLGERGGLAPLEEIVMALELLYNVDTGVNAKKLYRLSQLAEKSIAKPIPFNKPIVGETVFSHDLHMNIHGMLTNPLMVDPFPPKIVGRTTAFYIGKQISKELVTKRLELAHIQASPRQIDTIYTMIRRAGDRLDKGAMQMTFYHMKKLQKEMHKGLTEDDFWLVVKKVTGKSPQVSRDL